LKTPAYRQRIGERLGFIKSITGRVIWVHCVSMGEFRAAIVLIDALIKAYPLMGGIILSINILVLLKRHLHNYE
jgi:3-deoxy-D-manno-octulosonic-acid transferase